MCQQKNYTIKKKVEFFEKYIRNFNDLGEINKDLKVAVITPDKDIIPNAETLNPAYIVFENYEIILQWNRSLRFALAVCTLKDKIKMKFNLVLIYLLSLFLFGCEQNISISSKKNDLKLEG